MSRLLGTERVVLIRMGESASRSRPRSLRVRKSYGIILCRNLGSITNVRLEALLVHKRHTYAFAEFVYGHYDGRDFKRISSILSHMTSEELLDVWSLNFSQMWFRIWLSYDYSNTNYEKKARKFNNVFMKHDRGVRLRAMIEQLAPSGTLIYEFPKGKKNDPKESNLTCAMRELSEEAGVTRRMYKIVPGFSKLHSFVHMNVQYEVVYYLALLKRPTLFRHVQTVGIANGEVSSAHWMSIEQIAVVDNSRGTLQRIVRPAFNYVRKYIKGKPQYGINVLEQLEQLSLSNEREHPAEEQADRRDHR